MTLPEYFPGVYRIRAFPTSPEVECHVVPQGHGRYLLVDPKGGYELPGVSADLLQKMGAQFVRKSDY